jgi:glycosyltransferase involved in cell wall biosynthesis
MKIGIFNEPKGLAFGGTEFCVATLAEALCARHEVVILHRKREMTTEMLERFYGSPLPSVKVRRAPHCPRDDTLKPTNWRHALHERIHDQKWTAGYDLFVNFTHGIPPFCWSPSGVLIVLFPVGNQPVPLKGAGFSLRQWTRETLANRFWRERMGSYQAALAISEYTREWTRNYWGIDCGILHPPCRTASLAESKEDLILSVGRFTPLKRQTALMKAYASLEPRIPASWKYRSVGPLACEEEAVTYYREVAALTTGTRAEILTNLSREALDKEFRRASIFWHGAGESDGKESPPLMAEHFGITTVEAMSAGCVPVVYRGGGQREIVEHGISGFLWTTIGELLSYTKELIENIALRSRMSAAASRRAEFFSQKTFVGRFKDILGPKIPL